MGIVLRGYQKEIISDVRELMLAGQKRILVCSPTGSGKTALTTHMMASAASKKMHSIFGVHRRELIKQSILAFDKSEVFHGIIASKFPEDPRPFVQIASIPSLGRRLKTIKEPKLIVWDECHHIAAGTWAKIFKKYPDAYHIGLTATPERLDGKGLKDWFDVIVKGPSVKWLIDEGWLSPYKMFAPSKLDMTGVKKQMGDFAKKEVNELIDKPTITGDVIKEYLKVAKDKRAVVFCASILHSKHVAEQFNACGVSAVHVDGETSIDERDAAIANFKEGKIKVMCNVDLFGEGFDLPSLEAVILLRPTQSLGLYLQQVGRALRIYEGKNHAIILDHVGNHERHGFPDDEREWSLDGKKGRTKKGEKVQPIKVCDSCFAAQFPGAKVCKHCGYEFKIEPRSIQEVDGELEEIDPNVLRKKRKSENIRAESLEDLIALGRSRGYKSPEGWAYHIHKARTSKRR